MEHLIQKIDEIFLTIESLDDLSSAAFNIEAVLGEIQRDIQLNAQGTTDATDPVWEHFCLLALKKAEQLGLEPFAGSEQEAANSLYDNYFHVALSLVMARDDYFETPALAWAAFNKNEYPGFKDEIACVRLLTWAGFDPNAQDGRGMTALHYMASWKNLPASQPRGVRILLEAGANPDIQNLRGDTPLIFMAGNITWHPAMSMSAAKLLNAGADITLKANDGATFLSLLKEGQAKKPDPGRQVIIEAVENGMFAAQE